MTPVWLREVKLRQAGQVMSDFDAQEKRIAKAIGEDGIPEVNDRSLKRNQLVDVTSYT